MPVTEKNIQQYVKKYLDMVGRTEKDLPQLSVLVLDILRLQGLAEGKKVDRMVQHIKQSEIKAGESPEEAENIAWATVNKRGYLDNKNKKKGK
jgi:hypothetical protein